MNIIAILVSIVLIVIDQVTKYIAGKYLIEIGSMTFIKGILDFTYVENRGAAFGIMQGQTLFFVITTTIALIAIIIYYCKLSDSKVDKWIRVALVLIFSGAVGNFIDRVLQGYVIDFFDAKIISFMNFPVFNVADVYVVVGTILWAVLILFFVKEDDNIVDK